MRTKVPRSQPEPTARVEPPSDTPTGGSTRAASVLRESAGARSVGRYVPGETRRHDLANTMILQYTQ